MTKYLLECDCGNKVAVDVGQAGGRVACQCGAQLDVPPLRKLRHLPTTAPSSEDAAPTWSPRKGVIAVFLLLASVASISALWMWINEPTLEPFNHELRMVMVDRGLDDMTPVQGWQMWTELYQPLAERGFTIFKHRDAAAVEADRVQQQFTRKMLWSIAGVCAAVAITAALWPRAAAAPPRKR